MTTSLTDEQLEARLIATFDEVIPRLRALPAHAGPGPLEAHDELALRRVRRETPTHRRRVALAAAAIGIVAGAGVLWMADRGHAPSAAPPATDPPVATAPPFDPAVGSPLSAAMPFDTRPLVVADGWAYDGQTGLEPVSADPPSAFCPGCGTDRLVVAADGALFDGPMLTAWIAHVPYEPADMDWPVSIGGVDGRFMAATDPIVPAGENRVTVMWPIGPDRTAYVEAFGLSNDDVFAMAAALDVSGQRPAISPPAGYHVVDAPRPAGASSWYGTMEDSADRQTSPTYRTLQVYATNAGLQGLLDWRYPPSRMLMLGWTPRVVDGVTVAFDDGTADPESAGNASAIWVAGDWAYVVVGQRFTTGDEFAAAVAALRLTDQPGFDAATADAAAAFLSPVEEEQAKQG